MRIKKEDITALEKIASRLNIPAEFGPYDDSDDCAQFEDVRDQVEKIMGNENFFIGEGCTKYVIIPNSLNAVIKIPFSGMWTDDCDEEEDSFHPFEYANDLYNSFASEWDYCENELIKYDMAVEAGFEEFFAETALLGTFHGRKFYIQEKVTAFVDKAATEVTPSEDSKKKYEDNRNKLVYINKDWMALAIEWYGLEKVIEFCAFLRDFNLSQDLHTGNIGFAEDGRPVLLDFSGYRED